MHVKSTIIFTIIFLFINYNLTFAVNLDTNYEKPYVILIDLNERCLFLIKSNSKKIIKSYPIASGKNKTPSPIGTWKIIDKGAWSNAFGTRWMGLNVPWGNYGIHGTSNPSSIGTPASMGCIRMNNGDAEDLYDRVSPGTVVIIYGGAYGLQYNHFRTLSPGNTGTDVLEVQRVLKNKGYYPYILDGIYGDGLKKSVIQYEIDNHLTITHDINHELYKALNMLPFE